MIKISKTSQHDVDKDDSNQYIEKSFEFDKDQLILEWKYKDIDKKLVYDIKKCIGCSLCQIVCPVDAIELGPIPEIAQNILDDSNPKILIDYDKCCYCMLCAIVCPNDAFHENILPEGEIDLEQFPSIDKFYRIDEKDCIKDTKNEACLLCLKTRERNHIKDYFEIEKKCPTKCFHIDSPIEGEVIIKKNMLHKCSPENCKACINICPVESFYIPKSAEDVVKYGKIACNEDQCFYCGACENSCPDDLIIVNRKNIKIVDPKKTGNYPWKEGWIKNIKEILKLFVIKGKEQIDIPAVEQEIKETTEKIIENVPQLSKEDRDHLNELNDKIQKFLKSSKIRYWIKDKKTEKISKEFDKYLKKRE
ncbi:MAG: 4Fe-4S dicluster domain-containing protein [Promethearchaeota archaeon]